MATVSARCREHLFLDPKSGIRMGKNLSPLYGNWDTQLKGAELVSTAQAPGRESKLTLVFADTQRDNFGAKYKRVKRMLAGIRRRYEIHGRGYVSSRMALVWVSVGGELVKEATERLLSRATLPLWRVVYGGGERQWCRKAGDGQVQARFIGPLL